MYLKDGRRRPGPRRPVLQRASGFLQPDFVVSVRVHNQEMNSWIKQGLPKLRRPWSSLWKKKLPWRISVYRAIAR